MNIAGIARLKRVARRITNVFVPRAIVLLYHRVIELPSDPQLLCVSPRHFSDHLEVIRKCGRSIQVKKVGELFRDGHRGDTAIVITFDDGYADNLSNARPMLERCDLPATVFVTTGYLGSEREFWYDDLERILLTNGPLPEILRLRVNERWCEWELASASRGENGHEFRNDWNVTRRDDPTVRHTVYRSLFQILQPMPDAERKRILEELARWAGTGTLRRASHRALAPEELIQLADGNLVEIGSHTVSHPMLSAIPVVAQVEEICRSKSYLEDLVGHPIRSFAYPFGGRSHYTSQTMTAVRDAGFESACSNFAGVVYAGTDRWQLPRFIVRDWDGENFARNLRGWLDA